MEVEEKLEVVEINTYTSIHCPYSLSFEIALHHIRLQSCIVSVNVLQNIGNVKSRLTYRVNNEYGREAERETEREKNF